MEWISDEPPHTLCHILGCNQNSRNFWDSKSRWVLVHFHWLSTKVNSLTVCFPSPPLLVIIRRKMQFYYVGNPSILKLPDYLKTFQVNLRLGWKIYNTFIVWGILIIDGWQNWALLWILNLEIDIDWLGSCVWFGFYAILCFPPYELSGFPSPPIVTAFPSKKMFWRR